MSTPTYRRQAIIEFVLARLALITIANGYATDAGLTVAFGGVPSLGPDDPDVGLGFTVPTDNPKWTGAHTQIDLPLQVHAVAKATLSQPYLAAEVVLGDIKRAVEMDDRTFGRLLNSDLARAMTTAFPRREGSEVVGVSIGWLAPYRERWGHPEV